MSGSSTPAPLDADAVVSEIEKEAASAIPRIKCFSDWTRSFTPIEGIVDRYLGGRLGGLSDTAAEALTVVAKDRRSRLPLSTGITDQIVGICQQILAFGAAGVALMVGFADKIKQFTPLAQETITIVGIFYFELVAVSLLVLILYLLQARFRYPSVYFEKIGNAWPFFYYASITPVDYAAIQCARPRYESAVAYAKDLVRFAGRFPGETPQQRLRTELQQYFLLMSFQAYVNQFSLRLANTFMYGFSAAVITAIILLVAVWGGFL